MLKALFGPFQYQKYRNALIGSVAFSTSEASTPTVIARGDSGESMASAKHLRVTNLPIGATAEMLKALFGPFGPIRRIKMYRDHAVVKYETRGKDSVKRALSHSEKKGFNLKRQRLLVNPLY